MGGSRNSPWSRDVSEIPVERYAHRFPSVLTANPANVLEKIAYRLWLIYLKMVSKGSPYDRAILDRGAFYLAFVEKMDAFKPDVVIATGAPFRLLAYIADVINAFPNSRFIADIRDPWTWGESYGYAHLSEKRLNFEKQLEAKVVSQFHFTTSPWPEIVSRLQKLYPAAQRKISLLPHAYDPDDFPAKLQPAELDKELLVFGGNIYHGLEDTLNDIIAFVRSRSKNLRIEIYSGNLNKIHERGDGVKMHAPIPALEFFEKAQRAQAVIFLIPEHLKDGVPTKLFEYAYLGRPIIAMGYRGRVSEFVEEKSLGIFVDDVSELGEIDFELLKVSAEPEWLEAYNYANITEGLLKLINGGELK
ncbi:MAG: hypothetical protein LC664_13560 [Flavobacteriales bacterium]|nr:hypothetical protein [Flavobacteriales bacterium]